MQLKPSEDRVYFAIRMTDGSEWIDSETCAYLPEYATEKANATNEKIPHWAVANPVVRVALFEVREVKA